VAAQSRGLIPSRVDLDPPAEQSMEELGFPKIVDFRPSDCLSEFSLGVAALTRKYTEK
jgi:hypothetical protein